MTIFVMHIQRQSCARCGRAESLSQLYQAEELPLPGKANKLLPCHSIGPLDPVHKVELPIRQTPCCVACCDDAILQAGNDIYARWQETLRRKAQQAVAARPTTERTPPRSKLEDLA